VHEIVLSLYAKGLTTGEILRRALEKSPSSMVITAKEVGDFRSGRRRSIKDEAHNPFKSMGFVYQVASDAWSPEPEERGSSGDT
jgi:hypothetical protein